MKECTKCKKEKTTDDFNKRGSSLQSVCKECNKDYLKEHYNKNKNYYKNKASVFREKAKEKVRQLKNQPCLDCGVSYPYYVMDFDHLENKEFNISTAINNMSYEKVLAEIQKCEIICSNCHRFRTYKRNTSTG
jgi:hypothetical protein